MKINTVTKPVERVGVQSESTASIEVNEQMFELLSSGIYTDPILAVIRELSCNAYDSHVEVGRENVPFSIHLPNRLEPWFSIRDYGAGLSHEDVHGLYMTYGRSTKNDSNDFIGAFGIGSKAPFSYADSFSVVSIFDGNKSTYNIHKNEQNIPAISCLAHEDTNDHNGLEIKLTVRDGDFSSFANRAKEVLRFFPTLPKVIGCVGFQIDKRSEPLFETNTFSVFERINYNGKFTAIQGHVPYVVNKEKLRKKLTSHQSAFLANYDINCVFPIGTIAIASSREEVRYTDLNVDTMCSAIANAHQLFLKHLDEDLVNIKGTLWQVYSKLNSMFSNKTNFQNIVGNYKFQNKKVMSWISSGGSLPIHGSVLHNINAFSYSSKCKAKRKLTLSHKDFVVSPNARIFVILADVRQRYSVRVNNFIKQKAKELKDDSLTLIRAYVLTTPRLKNLYEKDFVDERKTIVEEFGDVELLKLSEISDDVVATQTGSRGKRVLTFKQFSGVQPKSNRTRPIFVDVDEPAEGLYVPVQLISNKIDFNARTIEWNQYSALNKFDNMIKVINYANGTSYKVTDIYGLTKSVVKYVSGKKEWNNLFDLFKKATKSLSLAAAFDERYQNTTPLYSVKDFILKNADLIKSHVDPKGHFAKFSNEMIKENNQTIKHINIKTTKKIAHLLDITTFEKQNKDPFFTDTDIGRYKLFGALGYSGLTNRGNDISLAIVEYINMIDEKCAMQERAKKGAKK